MMNCPIFFVISFKQPIFALVNKDEGNGHVPFSFLKDYGNRRKTDIVGAAD
jgi:hypothetical protein